MLSIRRRCYYCGDEEVTVNPLHYVYNTLHLRGERFDDDPRFEVDHDLLGGGAALLSGFFGASGFLSDVAF